MKILMTGASGFIGSRVVKSLIEAGYDVIALSSKNIYEVKTISSCGYKFDRNYLREQGAGDIDVLLLLGAFIPKSGKEANDIKKSTGNITSTQTLLDSEFTLLKKIIFISSVDVFGNYDRVIKEDTFTSPVTMYGWSKLYGEQMVTQFGIQNDIQYEILRLGHVFGEGEEVYRKVMPVMIQNAIQGEDITIYGNGKAIRSFIYIDDVVKAIVNAVDLDKSKIINIVGNEQITINKLAEKIRSASGADITIKHIEITTPNRDCVFDNHLLMSTLLDNLTPFDNGLKKEISYMRRKLS